jgi:hypothetical protein
VADADLDSLFGDGDGAAGADPAVHADSVGCGCRWWSGGPGVAQAAQVGRCERVGQAAQCCAVGVEDVQDAVVEAGGDAAAGEVVADADLPSGQGDDAVGVHRAVDLDRVAGLGGAAGDWRWPGGFAAVGE